MNYELLYKLEREAHQETFDKCNDEVIRLIKEKNKLQKEVESLQNELESIINDRYDEHYHVVDNTTGHCVTCGENVDKEYKLVKVEYYA